MENQIQDSGEARLRRVVTWVTVLFGTFFLLGITTIGFYLGLPRPVLEGIYRDHALAMLGIPMGSMFALLLVIIFQAAAGPIEFETPFGFKFRGASGPLVLWVLCFLALVTGGRLLW